VGEVLGSKVGDDDWWRKWGMAGALWLWGWGATQSVWGVSVRGSGVKLG